MDKILHDLKDYGIFLIMGNAGFCPSTVLLLGFIFSLGAAEE